MTALRRAFVAVVPPPDVLRWTDAAADSVRWAGDGLLWTRPEQRHITLRFLGAVAEVDALVGALDAAVRGAPPFLVALGGAGAFPSPRRASVLWLGVHHGAEQLDSLATSVTRATAALGVTADARPYRPHVTLARGARARDLEPMVEQLSTVPPGRSWLVDSVVLFESTASPRNGRVEAVHVPYARISLGALT